MLKGNGTRHGRGTREKKNRLQSLLMFSRTFRIVKSNLIIKPIKIDYCFAGVTRTEDCSLFVGVCGLCFRITNCCCRANFASGGLSSMLSTKETPENLLPFLYRKTRRALGIAVDFVSVYSKCKKVTNFSTYPRRTSREERCLETASVKTFIRRSGTSPFRVISQESTRSVH